MALFYLDFKTSIGTFEDLKTRRVVLPPKSISNLLE